MYRRGALTVRSVQCTFGVWRVAVGRLLYDGPFVHYMETINTFKSTSEFCFYKHNEKSFIIKYHILITWTLYTIQKCQKRSIPFNVIIHASTVPSLIIAMARFRARESLRSSTLVSSMSSSWNQKCTRMRSVPGCDITPPSLTNWAMHHGGNAF